MPLGYKVTTRQEAAVLEYYRQGMTQKDAGEAAGISVGSARMILRKNHVKPRGWGYGFAKKQDMLLCYETGASVVDIARNFSCCPDAVADMLKRDFGIRELRGAGHYNRKYSVDHTYFDAIDNQEKAYWLGFIVADGCNRVSNLSVAAHRQDHSHLEKLRTSMSSTHPFKRGSGNCEYLQVNSSEICRALSRFGVIPAKSHRSIYPDIPPMLDVHFIRGLWDGDGGMSLGRKHGKCPQIMWTLCGTRALLTTVQAVVLRETEVTYLPIQQHSTIFRLYTGGNKKVRMIMEWLYDASDVCLERKRDRYYAYSETVSTWNAK
jgi:hypothetical protein